MGTHGEKHHGPHHPGPGYHGDGEHPKDRERKWHRDWRVWAVVVILLAAMAAYVFTIADFSAIFGNGKPQAPPAPQGAKPAP